MDMSTIVNLEIYTFIILLHIIVKFQFLKASNIINSKILTKKNKKTMSIYAQIIYSKSSF